MGKPPTENRIDPIEPIPLRLRSLDLRRGRLGEFFECVLQPPCKYERSGVQSRDGFDFRRIESVRMCKWLLWQLRGDADQDHQVLLYQYFTALEGTRETTR